MATSNPSNVEQSLSGPVTASPFDTNPTGEKNASAQSATPVTGKATNAALDKKRATAQDQPTRPSSNYTRSRIAIVCIAVLVICGIFETWLLVQSLQSDPEDRLRCDLALYCAASTAGLGSAALFALLSTQSSRLKSDVSDFVRCFIVNKAIIVAIHMVSGIAYLLVDGGDAPTFMISCFVWWVWSDFALATVIYALKGSAKGLVKARSNKNNTSSC